MLYEVITIHTEDVLLINPSDAEQHGIVDGDLVCVESPRGKVDVRARLTSDVNPGVLSTTFHFPVITSYSIHYTKLYEKYQEAENQIRE